jgi:hypothetical protein
MERYREGISPAFGRTHRMQLISLQRVAETALVFYQHEIALEALEAASRMGIYDIAWLTHCPLFDTLAGDPRFLAIHRTVAERASRILARFVDAVPSSDGRR